MEATFNPLPFTEEDFTKDVQDINDFIEKRIKIDMELHGNLEPWLDIMTMAIRLSNAIGRVVPLELYAALLESGKKYDRFEGQNVLRGDCIMHMGMLLPLRLFTTADTDIIGDYTVFTPVNDHRWVFLHGESTG